MSRAEDPLYEPAQSRTKESQRRAAPAIEEPLRSVHGPELLREVPDLIIRDRLTPFSFSFGFATNYPLLGGGLGVGLELNLWTFLQVRAEYAVGLIFRDDRQFAYGNYAEGMLGIRLLNFASERDVDVYPGTPLGASVSSNEKERPRAEFRAHLPAHHWVFVDGGVITGPLNMMACTANCEAPPEQGVWERRLRQLVFPFAGLRYTYFIDVSSVRRRDVTRRMRVELSAHLIGRPFDSGPSHMTHWGFISELRRNDIGGRAGVTFPTCKTGRCPALHLEVGYLPMPATIALALEVSAGSSWISN